MKLALSILLVAMWASGANLKLNPMDPRALARATSKRAPVTVKGATQLIAKKASVVAAPQPPAGITLVSKLVKRLTILWPPEVVPETHTLIIEESFDLKNWHFYATNSDKPFILKATNAHAYYRGKAIPK